MISFLLLGLGSFWGGRGSFSEILSCEVKLFIQTLSCLLMNACLKSYKLSNMYYFNQCFNFGGVVLGRHQAILWVNSWLCALKSLLVSSGDHLGSQWSNLSWLICLFQAGFYPKLLYSCSGPLKTVFQSPIHPFQLLEELMQCNIYHAILLKLFTGYLRWAHTTERRV